MIGVNLIKDMEQKSSGLSCPKMGHNVLHKTSKGMREMNYQDTQQFERATMLKLPIQPLLVLCGVTARFYLSYYQCIRK
jgi:hypothetical protein